MMKKITKYYSSDEIVEAVLTNDPEFRIVCQLIWDDSTTEADIKKVKNKEL
jgi:hypothetical protein